MAFTETQTHGITNGTSTVTMLSAPSAGNRFVVKGGSVHNADTAAATVTIQYNFNGTTRIWRKIQLAVGACISIDADDLLILDSTTTTLEILLAGAITTNNLPFTLSYAVITS